MFLKVYSHFCVALCFIWMMTVYVQALLADGNISSHQLAFARGDCGSRALIRPRHNRVSLIFQERSSISSTLRNDIDPPYLALITEPDACNTEIRMQETVNAVEKAISTKQKPALISVRTVRPDTVPRDDYESRVVDLTGRLMALSHRVSLRVVVTSDWIAAAKRAGAHGIHVKERDRPCIPEIRREFGGGNTLIGTSVHSVTSALDALQYEPDYLFVGTCYPTASHPDKKEMEGPELPGTVKWAIAQKLVGQEVDRRPVVFAIGGIDESNCKVPLVHGADGVAVIRSVLQAADPAEVVNNMFRIMRN